MPCSSSSTRCCRWAQRVLMDDEWVRINKVDFGMGGFGRTAIPITLQGGWTAAAAAAPGVVQVSTGRYGGCEQMGWGTFAISRSVHEMSPFCP